MGANNKRKFSSGKTNRSSKHQNKDKFNLVSCPMKESFCNKVLLEINELYAQSELAHINKEYLISVELLEEAHTKTLELKETNCINCVELFQTSINQTLETMKKDLPELSQRIFNSKRLPTSLY